MNIAVILRNISDNQNFYEEEECLAESDRNVISEAMTLKETCGGSVSALLFSADTPENRDTLIKSYTYGVDHAYHILLNGFDFSNTRELARVIAATIKQISLPYDLILFGRLAYDGDAVTVASMTAEYLHLPHAAYSSELYMEGSRLFSKKHIFNIGEAVLEIQLPAMVQSIREKGVRRQPKIADIVRAYSDAEICRIDGKDIQKNVVASSTVTLVDEWEPNDRQNKNMRLLNGANDAETASTLIETLQKLGFNADN